jgi:hypothetical protein
MFTETIFLGGGAVRRCTSSLHDEAVQFDLTTLLLSPELPSLFHKLFFLFRESASALNCLIPIA